MKKSEFIKMLEEIPGDPEMVISFPGIMGTVTRSINLIPEKAGQHAQYGESEIPLLHIQRYYPRAVKTAHDVLVMTVWPVI